MPRLIYKALIIALVILFPSVIYGSTQRRQAYVSRTTGQIRIDGKSNEPSWSSAVPYEEFTQYEPANGYPSSFKTRVRMLFDDEGIYVFAELFDSHPDSIALELGKRDSDNEINADWFSIDLCPFDDGVNGFSFKVTITGVQTDIKRGSGSGGRDVTWDAVWDSHTLMSDTGWSIEIFIPFSSIRFPVSGNQPWGVNFHRFVARRKEVSSWNFTDKRKGNTISQTGAIIGFTGINPPVRLSLMPYVSAYLDNTKTPDKNLTHQINGGMDLKWGLNESFTVDATLIPDFNQLQADDQVLNLTPYEIQYDERRQFFTEGTDLFSKADIFYTRRIGARPRGYLDAETKAADESMVLIFNPIETTMINATKVSGRTKSGLGIGFFNALTAKSKALFEDPITSKQIEYVTEPLTNFNMIVIDHSLPYASYISLVNTNVLRSGSRTGRNYISNVTATDMQFYSRGRMFSLKTIASVSQKYFSDKRPETGHSLMLSGGKTGGKYTIKYEAQVVSDSYDQNDMGYQRRNNLVSNDLTIGYNLYIPKGLINSSRNNLSFSYDRLFAPSVFNDLQVKFTSVSIFTNFWTLSFNSILSPVGSDDYFEPRVEGRMYYRQPSAVIGAGIGTDPRRVLRMEMEATYENHFYKQERFGTDIAIRPSVRFSNRLSAKSEFSWARNKNDEGFAGIEGGEIIFGQRDNRIMSFELYLAYMFSARSYLSLRLREYWATAEYSGNYYLLNNDGSLTSASLTRTDNNSYNAFTADLNYTWRFAPGSELILVMKEALNDSAKEIPSSLSRNLSVLFAKSMNRSLSFKVIWYLDYHTISARGFFHQKKKGN